MDKFIDRVSFRIEEALQSNEIINVFQDDFEMLGNEEETGSKQISSVNMVPRAFYEQEYCKEKIVSCIKFHPTKPHLVAMALVEDLDFNERTERMNKFNTNHVLILNFSDAHIITLNYILTTPVEITVIEFHPENPNILIGGALNGQVVAWDIASPEHRINAGRKRQTVAKMPDEEEDKTQQVAVKLKQLVLSNVEKSHRSYVSDIQFIPGGVKVDKKHPNDGNSVHFLSCSEDGICLIWDTRAIDKSAMREAREKAKNQKYDYEWIPWLAINLFRQDGSGEVGLSRVLF
jgi:dynein intermediate chain 3, axonemal